MHGEPTSCWAKTGESGLTLIEVTAALAILAVLMASVVGIKGRALNQWHRARMKLQAVEAADRLMTRWAASGGPPFDRSGTVQDGPPLRWKTSWVPAEIPRALEPVAMALQLDNYPPASEHGPPDTEREPLVTLHLLAPAARVTGTERSSEAGR
jgi:prepilin-type N-terminal cleavage/methylation domain-containing protein